MHTHFSYNNTHSRSACTDRACSNNDASSASSFSPYLCNVVWTSLIPPASARTDTTLCVLHKFVCTSLIPPASARTDTTHTPKHTNVCNTHAHTHTIECTVRLRAASTWRLATTAPRSTSTVNTHTNHTHTHKVCNTHRCVHCALACGLRLNAGHHSTTVYIGSHPTLCDACYCPLEHARH